MKVSITCIELKSIFHFFKLSLFALQISNQLKTSNVVTFKKKGFWTKHYTMTLWQNEDDMKVFAYSGAHMDAIKKAKLIAKEIKSITIEYDTLLNWKEAQTLLRDRGTLYKY